jgi:hypothetical protein
MRTLTRRARRAVRRRIRKAVRDTQKRIQLWRMHRQRQRLEVKRMRAAQPLAARSLAGTPRPPKASTPRPAAPIEQRVRRDKGGRFNGSTGAGKKTAKTVVPAAQRDLARGDATLRRVEARLARTEKRIDRMT